MSSSKIKFIKNEREKIEKIYNEYVEKAVQYQFYGYNRIPTQIAMEVFDNKTNIEENGFHSWFHPQMPGNTGCINWHIDVGKEVELDTHMLISTFNSATQFAIPKTKLAEEYNISRQVFQCTRFDENLDNLINDGHFEVFTPELGDIYWVGPQVIHRSNPDCTGKPRLCLRLYKPEGYED
jgi:hypothetical protein